VPHTHNASENTLVTLTRECLGEKRLGVIEAANSRQENREGVHCLQRAWVVVAERVAVRHKRQAEELLCLSVLVLGEEERSEISDGLERVDVVIAKRMAPRSEGRAVEQLSFVKAALRRRMGELKRRENGSAC
jgi:hypothetical protein